VVVNGYHAKSQCHGVTFSTGMAKRRQFETATAIVLFGYSL
jgi:hypothetical protein